VELPGTEVLQRAAFDAIAAQIVVIDARGDIIDVNRAWEQSLGTQASAAVEAPGRHGNYLEMCRRAVAAGHEGASEIVEIISAVLSGHVGRGRVEYRGQPRRNRDQWFALTVTPLGSGSGAVLLHENISVQRQLEGEILEIGERERAQVGQELHDGLCQHLGGVALLAKTLSNALTNAQRPEAGQALELAQLIYAAVGQTRAVARGLRPVELDEGGLLAALHDLADQANPRVSCEIRTNGNPRVNDNEVATHFYRIAHEALNNAVKHSHARRIVIRLRQSADHLTLIVEDDGVGLPADLDPGAGLGLRIMRYRANSIGARLSVKNRTPRGLAVTCSVPLANPVPADSGR
jgi:signal transduction histidine kinase